LKFERKNPNAKPYQISQEGELFTAKHKAGTNSSKSEGAYKQKNKRAGKGKERLSFNSSISGVWNEKDSDNEMSLSDVTEDSPNKKLKFSSGREMDNTGSRCSIAPARSPSVNNENLNPTNSTAESSQSKLKPVSSRDSRRSPHSASKEPRGKVVSSKIA
jgi:hypothetical protein